ncbi:MULTISPECIES: carbohydrate ABC transporter permease [unclassified Sutcliffiella]|uniref:carbohydrate ABC transporter permease n=1 Tax=unclassified Sutcliffiella TaxID=2837532 RepID=UPI0030D27C2A
MRTKWWAQLFKYMILFFFAFIFLYPIFLMISSSLKSNKDIFTSPLGLPSQVMFENYATVWNKVNFSSYFLNSVIVSVSSVFLVLFVSSLGAYYLARYKFKWNGLILFFFLIGLMVPMKLAILPLYLIFMNLGILDTLIPLIIVYVAGGIPLAVFVFYAFFRTLPSELEQSARMDGCNEFQVYTKIVLPLMKAPVATIGIINLIGVWNDFFYPLIFIRSDALKTIPLGMLTLFGEFDTQWNLLFAGLTISALPMIIAFLFASKQFMEGLTSGAIK